MPGQWKFADVMNLTVSTKKDKYSKN